METSQASPGYTEFKGSLSYIVRTYIKKKIIAPVLNMFRLCLANTPYSTMAI